MFIFPDLGGATPNHRLAFPGEGKEVHQKSPLLQKHAQQLLWEQPSCYGSSPELPSQAATNIQIDIHTSVPSFI